MATIDSLLFNISSFIAGLFLLEYGADKFIDHTAIVAKRLNVSPTLVGLLTCGAEWEELVVIIVALSQKNSNMALGNLIGSSVANILASFSLGLLFMKKAEFDRSSKIYSTALLGLTTVFLLLLLALKGSSFQWFGGILLIVAFVVYVVSVASLIYRGTLTAPEDSDSDSDSSDDDGDNDSDSDSDDDDRTINANDSDRGRPSDEEQGWSSDKGHQLNLLKPAPNKMVKAKKKSKTVKVINKRPKAMRHHVFQLALGLAALLVSSYIIAHSASTIGHELALSGTVVGTTILSLATTLPEKFVAILGGARHQPGIMVANTVGSNIFLVTLCGGVLFIWGDASQLQLGFTLFEATVMWLSAVVIFGIVMMGGRRWMGVVMLIGYVAFLVVEIMNGRELDDE
ncbi:Sodium/calcium exchanger protein-domain-containing protein [Neurospora hispaniola]|uniref:Sodium/calcium exchanger protein-domain-containing protein n=1 Tax=Neurospora hispaniola TaxID=588809 RepID=A0AAJ0MQM4_9PEZI|nr:Sodium/calcium exchanger protein-domain-containing protein [Neurospora hispaniola]